MAYMNIIWFIYKLKQVYKKLIPFFKILVLNYFTPFQDTISKIPSVFVEVTNKCNSKCVHCPNKHIDTPRDYMKMPLFMKVIDDFDAMGGGDLNFYVTLGEPLLDPLLIEKGRYLKKFPKIRGFGFYTTLQWLHLFDLNDFFELVPCNITISIALSGRDKYLDFFGVDLYDQALKNLITFIKENNKRKDKFQIHFAIMQTHETRESIMNHNDFQMINKITSGQLLWSFREQGTCVDDWSQRVKLPSYLLKRPLYPRAFRPCRVFYKALRICYDGKVGLCQCRDYERELIVGDINQESLFDIWHGEKARKIRTDWRKKNIIPPICKRCSHYVYLNY